MEWGDLQHWSAPRRRAVRRVLWIVHLALPVPASHLQGRRRSRLGGGAAATSLCALECGHVGVAVSPARRRCLVTMEKVIKKNEKSWRGMEEQQGEERTADSSSSSNGSVSCEVL